MRLIDGDKLISVFETAFNGQIGITINEIAKEMLETQEEIDAVPVVRCKDCIYFDSSPTSDGGFICYCRHDDGLCDWIKEDYYCCLGERKEDSND